MARRSKMDPRDAANYGLLEAAREKYEVLAKQAGQAHDAYAGLMTSIAEQLAKDDETVRGFYGKTNRVVTEFGTKMLAKPGGRKLKPAPPPSA